MSAALKLVDKEHGKKRRRRRRGGKRSLNQNEVVGRKLIVPKDTQRQYNRVTTQFVRLTSSQMMGEYRELELQNYKESLAESYAEMIWWQNNDQVAATFVRESNLDHANAFYKSLQKSVGGFDLSKVVNEEGLTDIMLNAIDENVQALTDLQESSLRRVQREVNRALLGGTGKTESLEQALLKGFTTDLDEARFIARDQTQRFMNSLSKHRQEAVGVKKYKWSSSGDGRVRPEHAANNGKFFLWAAPDPVTGHPGHDYNCRCVPIPVFEV